MKPILLGTFLSILLLAGACKKDNAQLGVNSGLTGSWSEPPISTTMTRGLDFYKDSIFYVVRDYTDPANVLTTRINGTYSTDGHQLSTSFKEIVIRQKNNQVIYRTPFTGTLFDNATYQLDGNRLILHYTSYPADAPVATSMTLNRQLPD
ncbi:hypothetical protein HQ865_13660 [Mucilaginibacter mali]|uniref:Lipocalin-like domain-containing protein n=1 Tax=Mucilaginibacter mali TaxID=2740462 RepID=A0A7D4TPH1_9SPHI|nr:hypothetical protein [Mucilaginibacter mali]QKJ30754.1 hypothetical protein HQ865_13660 [Mucilaginibacter mali]